MHFLSQKAIKGQALTNFLAENPTFGLDKLYEDISDEIVEVHAVQTTFED